MLVLTRKVGETIVIDGGITITVTAVQGDRVRIGVTAPRGVPVDRLEVHQRRAEFAAEPDPADDLVRPDGLRRPGRTGPDGHEGTSSTRRHPPC
jgi:carbon storage regulator